VSAVLFALLLAPGEFVELYRQALEERIQQHGTEHWKTAESLRDLGLYLRENGKNHEAVPYLRRSLAIAENIRGAVAEYLEHLASVVPAREALELYERAIRIRTEKEPTSAALAATLERAAELAAPLRAEAMLRQSLAIRQSANAMNTLALLLQEQKPQEAESLFRQASRLNGTTLGRTHPETATTVNNLASLLLAAGRVAEAEPLQRQALKSLEASLGVDHPRVAVAASNLADILVAKGALAEAEALYRRTLAIDEKAYGPDHAEVAADLDNLATLLDRRGRSSAANALRQRAESIRSRR
jgi:tetratricopeptide (TPR) repeat protein